MNGLEPTALAILVTMVMLGFFGLGRAVCAYEGINQSTEKSSYFWK